MKNFIANKNTIKTSIILFVLGISLVSGFISNEAIDSLNISENKDYSIGLDNFGTQNKDKNKISVSKDSDYSNLYDLPLEKNQIEDFSTGDIRFDIGESNSSHRWVTDPTNQTEGSFIEIGSGYQELNSSRTQMTRHFYNESSNEYTFNSDILYNQTGVIDNTDWVTKNEYQYRFFFRLTDGSDYKFETPTEITNFYNTIDNSNIWCVGYESIAGAMAFYLNFQDLDWGHAQYLWYPRLKSGQLSAYNFPLYGMYPHLFARFNNQWYDKILNDRSLYDSPSKNPRNTLNFYEDGDTIGLYFTTDDISIINSNFNFAHGFKYNFTDQRFHLISEVQCENCDFQDIGWGYEITASPFSDNTPYQPERFRISNSTNSIELNVSKAWDVRTYLQNFYSKVEIISENNESFDFNFKDMEKAGFTEKYLNLHDQIMPDSSSRKTLLVGMYGYGSYSQGDSIKIDPDTGDLSPTDNFDLTSYGSTTWVTTGTNNLIGHSGNYWTSYYAFDTGIELALGSVSSALLKFYAAEGPVGEGNEYVDLRVYNVGADSNGLGTGQAREDSTSYTAGNNIVGDKAYAFTGSGTWGYREFVSADVDYCLEYWVANRYDSENYVSFKLEHENCWNDMLYTRDYAQGSNPAVLSFTYSEANYDPTATYHNNADSVHYAGKEYSFNTQHTDGNGAGDLNYVMGGLGSANNDIRFYVSNIDGVASTGTPTIQYGSSYIIGPASYSRAGITNGYEMTWSYTIDWDWTHDDSAVIDYFAYSDDDQAANSGWDTENLNYNYENELIVYAVDFNSDDSTAHEDGTADFNSNEWFRGGIGIRGTGTITYEGTTNVYPETTDVMAQLWVNGGDQGDSYDDAPDGSGAFITPYFPSGSTSGLDTTYGLDITLQNIPSGGVEGSGGVAGFNTRRDNQIPTATSYTHADSNSGSGYVPNVGYDDDLTADYTVNSPSDGSGSGLHATAYSYRWNGGGYGSYTSDSTPAVSVADGDSADSDIRIRDKVGNIASIDGENIVIDDDTPTGFTVTWSRHTGWANSYYAYLSGSTIYFNSGENDYFTTTINNDGTIQNSGYWQSIFDVNSIIDSQTVDTSGLPDSDSHYYQSAGAGSFLIRVVNNAGNYQEFSYTADPDSTDPTTTFSSITENTPNTYIYDSGQTVYFSDLMDSTDQLFTVVVTAGDTGGAGLYGVRMSAWDDDGDTYDTSSPYSRQYSTDSTETSGSINLYAYDNVGNYDISVVVITMTEDTTAPSGGTWTTDHDSTATQGYVPYSGSSPSYNAFYGQSSYTADASGWTDTVGIRGYQIKRNGGSYGSEQASASNVPCTLNVNALNDIYYQIFDNVGNYAANQDTGINVLYDTSDPSSFDIDIIGSALWTVAAPNYAWITDSTDISSGTLYLNSGETDSWSISMDNSGSWSTTSSHVQWKVVFEAGWGASEKSEEYFEWGGPNTHVFTSNSYATTPSESNIIIDIVNTCGNYQRITLTTTADAADPTSSTFSWTHTDSNAKSNGWDNDLSLYYTIGSDDSADTGSGLQIAIYRVQLNAEGWSALEALSGGTYHYYTASGEGSQTGYIRFYDKVGNYKEITGETITVDTSNPSFSNIGGSESSDYLYAVGATTDNSYYSDNMGATPTDFLVIGDVTDNYGLYSAEGSTVFSDTPTDTSITGTSDSFSLTYTITNGESGTKIVTVTLYDLAGNFVTDTYTFYEDNISPYGIDITLDVDSATIGYVPNTGYYDDNSVDVSVSGGSDDDSGITNDYRWQTDESGWGSWSAGSTHVYTSVSDGSRTLYVRRRDNVGNYVEDSVGVIVDTDSPSGHTVTGYRLTGYSNNYYAYEESETIYFNSVENDYFTIQVNNDGTIQNSGFWKIEWDKEGIFETPENDTSGLPDSKNFYYIGDSGGTLRIRLINNAGNYGEITFTATEDIDKPLQFDMIIDSLYHVEWEDIIVYMSTTDSGSDLLDTNPYEWWVNPTRDYGGTVYTATGEKTWTGITEHYPVFYGAVWDNVGNYRNASIMGAYFTITIIINPVDEIEEIIIGGFYNEEDVFFDYPSQSVSILVEENTEDEINLIENITFNHTVICPVFDDDTQNTSSMAKNNIMVINIIKIIPEPQWFIFMTILQIIIEFRRRHKKRRLSR